MEVNGTASAFSKCQADGRDRQISHCDNGKGMRLWSRVGRGAGFLLELTFKSSPERRAKSAFETARVFQEGRVPAHGSRGETACLGS